MKPGSLLVIAGGPLSAVALFLPFFAHGLFGSSTSLLQDIKVGGITNEAPLLLVPLAALLLFVGELLAPKMGRAAYAWSLSGALVGLPYLLIITQPFMGSARTLFYQGQMGPFYWLAAIGCGLGLIGAVLGLLERQAAPIADGAVEFPLQRW